MNEKSTHLHSLPDQEFLTGGRIADMLKSAGYIDSASTTISSNGWWNLTVAELESELASQPKPE